MQSFGPNGQRGIDVSDLRDALGMCCSAQGEIGADRHSHRHDTCSVYDKARLCGTFHPDQRHASDHGRTKRPDLVAIYQKIAPG